MDEMPAREKTDLEKKVDEYTICHFRISADMPEIYSAALNNVFLILKSYEDGFMLSDRRQKEISILTLENHKLLLELMRLNTRLKSWDLHISKAILEKNEASIDVASARKDADALKSLGSGIDALIGRAAALVDGLEKDYKGL